uniref:Uncharacterized protein n=1 Tax=Clytia hemisphaerica TaxID=252671 RepID=A0A7M5WI96_9CNID
KRKRKVVVESSDEESSSSNSSVESERGEIESSSSEEAEVKRKSKKRKKHDGGRAEEVPRIVSRNGRTSDSGARRREKLDLAIEKYNSDALAKGTKTTYSQGVKAYKKFEAYIQVNEENASPPDLNRILLFVAYLAYHRKLSYRCIHTYMCSVRNWVMKAGGRDPLQSKRSHQDRF